MEYLLKVSALLAIFYVSYKVFLQRDTFFNENRWFLILGIVTAFVLPFLVIPIYIEYTPVDVPNFNNIPTEVPENIEASFNILDYLPITYLLGVIGFSIRFVIQLTSLSLVISKSKKEKHGKYTYIKTDKNISPFSFFNWIVFNPNNFNNTELEQILIHEKIHSNQKHSIDVLLTQLSCIALWFNPFIWFYNKALKQNLEFIADNETQHQIDCKKTYQITLLKTSLPSHQMALTNNFHTSLIKKRIVMLHKSKSKKISLFKYAIVLPLLTLFLMSFNTEEVIINSKTEDVSNINNLTTSEDKLNLYIHKETTDNTIEKLKSDLAQKGYSLKIGKLRRNKNNLITDIKISVSYKASHSTNYSSNSSAPIKTINIIIDKSNHSITIKNSNDENLKIGLEITKAQVLTDTDRLYIIDGKIIEEKGFTLQEDNVKSINVLKGKSAIDKYGEKAKNGAIEITTKNNNQKNSDSVQTKKTQHKLEIAKDKQPLVYVDNEEVNYEDLKNLDTENIESMNVLKNKNATDKYGDKGKNGVIEITTKK
ncbi:M56 family metallopeptidase [Algibacter lectus]|uniref:Beta-lactamase regulating signal transducer with metallopeptidase domain n=1 Tax=Algibacter lectus TaxID=221126 RepID=A0A4R8MGI5_9FLAO|nr:M56 family metallopeptidase [Algibacter lectus]MWW24965.1 hypothetical protein [Algibacter lectus]TDY64624.1 beta-lactamase regulating signal transducer with metallopeptidase domain [Algibacter lectus]